MVEQKSYQAAILHLDSQEGDHSIVVKHGGDIFWAEQLFHLLALSLLVKSVKHHAHVHALKLMICAMYVWHLNAQYDDYQCVNEKNYSKQINGNAVDDKILKWPGIGLAVLVHWLDVHGWIQRLQLILIENFMSDPPISVAL